MDRNSFAEVEVQVAPAYAKAISRERLQRAAEAALRYEGTQGQVTLVITDDQAIQELNRDFLGRDTPTDVLAFSAVDDAGPFVVAPEAGGYLGDVIVSYPRAEMQAAEQGHSTLDELDLLVVHGLLHLMGYDHADQHEEEIMWKRQKEIMSHI